MYSLLLFFFLAKSVCKLCHSYLLHQGCDRKRPIKLYVSIAFFTIYLEIYAASR